MSDVFLWKILSSYLMFISLLMAESTDDESDFEIEYEALSHGSDGEWGAYNDTVATKSYNETEEINHNPSSDTHVKVETSTIPSTSIPMMPSNLGSGTGNDPDTQNNFVEKWEKFEDKISIEQRPRPNCEEQELGSDISTTELAEDAYHGLDDLESLMYEIGNMRDNLRLMPDFQRREMAAKLAMKMASMFADDTDDEVGL